MYKETMHDVARERNLHNYTLKKYQILLMLQQPIMNTEEERRCVVYLFGKEALDV